MNCRPGDLAVIVGGNAANYGALVRVIGHGPEGLQDEWLIEPLVSILIVNEFGRIERVGAGAPDIYEYDRALRPIRDPGEDARDETLIWKRVPSSSKEHA